MRCKKIFGVGVYPQAKAYGAPFKAWSMYILHTLRVVSYALLGGKPLRRVNILLPHRL